MIRFLLLVLGAASPAAAQIAPLDFETGKLLPLASGQWTYSATARGSESSYGSLVLLKCDRASRTVTIERVGAASSVISIATSSAVRTLPADGRLAATDPFLDAIAFSRGRFLVGGGAGPVLALPSWPEPARSIEDCRN